MVVRPRVLQRRGCPIRQSRRRQTSTPLQKPLEAHPYHLLQSGGARGGEGSSMSSAELFSAVARLQVRAVVSGGGGDPACACACVVSFDVWREALS